MKLRQLLLELLVLLPGFSVLLATLMFGHSQSPFAQWCVQYWWTVMVGCTLVWGVLRFYFFLTERGYVSL